MKNEPITLKDIEQMNITTGAINEDCKDVRIVNEDYKEEKNEIKEKYSTSKRKRNGVASSAKKKSLKRKINENVSFKQSNSIDEFDILVDD
jgi:flagellar motility protein MotE (MotC chaperone)